MDVFKFVKNNIHKYITRKFNIYFSKIGSEKPETGNIYQPKSLKSVKNLEFKKIVLKRAIRDMDIDLDDEYDLENALSKSNLYKIIRQLVLSFYY